MQVTKRAIQTIEILGYKSIRQAYVNLRALNVLIGANGAGKSNFISVFRFLNDLINQNLQLHVGRVGGADVLLHFGRKTTREMLIGIAFTEHSKGGRYRYLSLLMPAENNELIFAREKVSEDDQDVWNIDLGAGHRESTLGTRVEAIKVAHYIKQAMESWRIYHFQDTSDSAKVKQSGDIDDNRFLRPDASNLAAYLYLLRETEPDHYRQIVSAVRLIAPFFADFNLRPSPLNPDKIRLEWSERGSELYFNAHALSDGTLRFIALATLLLQPPNRLPATILLDEPELSLHPYAIVVLASLLRSAATHTQVIVSTQSVTLINQFGPEDILVVEKEGQASTFRRFDEYEIADWLDEYGMGDLWEKNIIGGRPSR